MPSIKKIDSIKIDLYSREHAPPHFHATYADFEILIVIKDLTIYAGKMPHPQLKKIMEWAKINQEMLIENFKRLNPKL
jgi:hypothetical protein